MQTHFTRRVAIALALAFFAFATPALSQTTSGKSPPPMAYHGGAVITEAPYLYLIWYGCWGLSTCSAADQADTVTIVSDFADGIGGTPYLAINSGYPDSTGRAPNGGSVYGGATADRYSHGATLTEADLDAIVIGQISTGGLPDDKNGIYVVLTSSDVTVEDANTHYCITCCNQHRAFDFKGVRYRSMFVGNAARCPGNCAVRLLISSPNANLGADAMVDWFANGLNATLTNPDGDAWYDRNGLENADKCEGHYDPTWTVVNPDGQYAQANIVVGSRHHLIQQNWVNAKKGYCAISLP
jgi:hypothetical protein